LNILADTATISTHLNDQPDGPFLPKLQSLIYMGWVTFSWKCLPIVFGSGTKERGTAGSPENNHRPLRSFRMELEFDPELDQALEADVVTELLRLNVEEGYEIQILAVSEEFQHNLLNGESIQLYPSGNEPIF